MEIPAVSSLPPCVRPPGVRGRRICSNTRVLAAFCGLTALSMLVAPAVRAQEAYFRGAPRAATTDSSKLLIQSPAYGQTVTGTSMKITLKVGTDLDARSLRVLLNKKEVGNLFAEGNCADDTCEESATISTSDGLVSGENRLLVTAMGGGSTPWIVRLARVKFDYTGYSDEEVPASSGAANYLPPAVGISANPGGASPWITITTGTPAGLKDSIDTTQYSVPYRDTTLPTETACQSEPLQVLVLVRTNPVIETSYQCFSDSSSLTTYLKTLDDSSLVIVGTTPGHGLPPSFDTTAIGGTDYSTLGSYYPNPYPSGYVAIGVPGAKAGSAYENYYTTADRPIGGYAAWFYGILSIGSDGYYNFRPSDNRIFTVSPNYPTAGASQVSISSLISSAGQIYTQTYTSPSGSNGFWLLTLDRVLLQPIDSSSTSGAKCPYNAVSTAGCGTFYATGSSDISIATGAVLALAKALSANPRQLTILTTVGTPFTSSSVRSLYTPVLAAVLLRVGGDDNPLLSLTTPAATYTLVSDGLNYAKACKASPCTVLDKPPFTNEVAFSTSAYTQQKQTGYISGVLARDLKSLYAPALTSQQGQPGPHSSTVDVDYSFHQIASYLPVDWPLTDTSGHIAAYHYASAAYLTYNFKTTGSHSQDIRYFYPGMPTQIGADNVYFQNSPAYPGDGHGFTAQDLADVKAQLYNEVTALKDTDAYLGAGGIGGVVEGSRTSNGMATDIISA